MLSKGIPKGLSFVSRNVIPTKCSKSQICQLLQVLFGKGTEIALTTDTDWRRIDVDIEFTKFGNDAMANIRRIHVSMKVQKVLLYS